MNVSIIIPVVRPETAGHCFTKIVKNAGIPLSEYEIVTDEDKNGIGCPRMVDHLLQSAQHDWIMFLGDDTIPQPGFLKNAIEAAKQLPGWGLVCLNDGIHNGRLATHWLAHRELADLNGGYFFHPDYHHLYCDRELTDIAQEHGVYVYAEDAVIEHDHPVKKGGEGSDEHYQRAYSRQEEDYRTYCRRKRERLTKNGPKVALCFPVTSDTVHTLFWQSMMFFQIPAGTEIQTPQFGMHSGDIALVRHDAVSVAIDKGCSHVLFMDTDQVYYDSDLIQRLLDHNKPIVGGKVHRRWPPYDPILNRGGKRVPDEEIAEGGLVPVDSTGTGCLLVDLEVFWKIGKPYFETIRKEGKTIGEDINFCRRAKAAGYDIYVDCDVKIGHLTTLEVGQGLYELFKRMRAKQ